MLFSSRSVAAKSRYAWVLLSFLSIGLHGGLTKNALAEVPPTPTAATALLRPISGQATDLSLRSDGAAFAIDPRGGVWRKAPGANSSWLRLVGNFERLRVGMDDSVWGITTDGAVYRLMNDTWWQRLPGTVAGDFTVGPDGTQVLLTREGEVLSLAAISGSTVRRLPTSPLGAAAVGLRADEHGLLWLWGAAPSSLYRFDGVNWVLIASPSASVVKSLAIGAGGAVWVIDGAGAAFRWRHGSDTWEVQPAPSQTVGVAIGPNDAAWFFASNGQISASDLFEPRIGDSVATKPALFTKLLTWQKVRGVSMGLSITPNGTVYSLDRDGGLWRWQAKDNWTSTFGKLKHVTANNAELWGLSATGTVLQLRSGYWTEMGALQMQDLAVGSKTELFAVSKAGKLLELDRGSFRWRDIALPAEIALTASSTDRLEYGATKSLSVDPKGNPWLIASNGTVWRRDGIAWESLPGRRATSLSVGPEGTAYITSVDQELFWFDPRERVWKPATGRATQVAVGPGGMPWIIGEGGALFASQMFITQSEQRLQAALLAAALPSKPIFTVPLLGSGVVLATRSVALTGFDGNFVDVAAGPGASVFVVGVDGSLSCLNPAERSFSLISAGTNRRVSQGPAGVPWIVNAAGDVARFVDGQWQIVANFKASDVTVAPDGRVFAIASPSKSVHLWSGTEFLPVTHPTGARILAARYSANGANSIAVTPSGTIEQCSALACTGTAVVAQDVVLGADGSRWAVSVAGGLLRYNARTDAWSDPGYGSMAGVSLSVSSLGVPWVVQSSGRLIAALPINTAKSAVAAPDCALRFKNVLTPVATVVPVLIARADVVALKPGQSFSPLANDALDGRAPTAANTQVDFNSQSPYLSFSNGAITLRADATVDAVVTATYTVCALPNARPCSTAQVSVTVLNPLVLVANTDMGTLAPGASFNLLANDTSNGQLAQHGINARFQLISSTLPRGVSVSAAGVVVGTPSQDGGVAQIGYSMCIPSGGHCVTSTATLTVVARAPTLLAMPDSGTLAVAGTLNLLANDTVGGALAVHGSNAQFQLISSSLPSGVIISGAGVLTGSARQAEGTAVAVYGLCQPGAVGVSTDCVTTSVSISVRIAPPPPPPPPLLLANPDSGTLAVAGTFSLLANDTVGGAAAIHGSNALFQLISSNLPSGVSISAAGVLTGSSGQAPGTATAVYGLCQVGGGGCITTNVSISVRPAPPLLIPNPDSGTLAVAGTLNLLANDTVGGAAAVHGSNALFQLINSNLPSGVSISTAGALTGSARQAAGTAVAVYGLCQIAGQVGGGGCVTTSVSISVSPAPPLLVANPDSGTLAVAGTLNLLANDTVGGAVAVHASNALFQLVSSNLPSGVSISAAGVLTGSARQAAGTAVAVYGLCQIAGQVGGGGCVTTSVSISVSPAPPLLVANPDSGTLAVAGTLNLLANDTVGGAVAVHASNALFQLVSSNLPSGVSISAAGVLTGSAGQADGLAVAIYGLCQLGGVGAGEGCVTTSVRINVSTAPTAPVSPRPMPP